ncbi:MAG: hypothetical protein K8R88_05995 [Armatimonadetes bacterium]|nr:hypothetical protein [Armatimonadota bacterium]
MQNQQSNIGNFQDDGRTGELVAQTAGNGVGVVGSLTAVSVLGVPGLSAAGITSGLAVLGFGSMLTGIGVVAGIVILGGHGASALYRAFSDSAR